VTVVSGAALVTPSGVLHKSWLRIDGKSIAEIGRGTPPDEDWVELDGGWLLPAYIDLHCHGGGGSDFSSPDPERIRNAALLHRQHGSAGMLASLVTAPIDDLCRQLVGIADIVERGDSPLLGAHLEGPFLSNIRCGAQNPAFLLEPDAELFAELADAARGTLRMITIAPELSGADEVIDAAVRRGILVAVGHSDATFAQATHAFSRGAQVATHLFNGMRPVHQREPGPALAALDFGVACELIEDGVHVHPSLTRLVARNSPEQLILVTDAVSPTGVGDGLFTLGGQPITVVDGQARLTSGGSLAGSTLTMDAAVRHTVVTCGLSIMHASAAASTNPARLLGIADRTGSLQVGRRADLLHLDADLQIRRMMIGGAWTD